MHEPGLIGDIMVSLHKMRGHSFRAIERGRDFSGRLCGPRIARARKARGAAFLRLIALGLFVAGPLAAQTEHPCTLLDAPFAICVAGNSGLVFDDTAGTGFEMQVGHESGAMSAVTIHHFDEALPADVQLAQAIVALAGTQGQSGANPISAPVVTGADSAAAETSLIWQGAPARAIITLATVGTLGLSVLTWAPESLDQTLLAADHRRVAGWMRAEGVESRP